MRRLNKSIVSILILLAILSIIPIVGAEMEMFIPGYFYPYPLGSYWDQAASGAPIASIIVMNPDSGPGENQNIDYIFAINNSQRNGQKVLGYVWTNYANRDDRPIEAVKSDIDKYMSWYHVDGIFLDGVSSEIGDENSNLNYYQELANYIQSKYGGFVALNPGNIPDQSYIDIGNTTVIFEGEYSTFKTWTPPAYVNNYQSENFTILVYNTTLDYMSAAIDIAASSNIHYVYVTDDILSNPWDALPSYWDDELNYLMSKNTPNMAISINGPLQKEYGTYMTYDLYYYNFGKVIASNVRIVDTIPANVEYVSSSDGGQNNAGTVTWNLGSVPPGGNGVVHVTVRIPQSVAKDTQISNTASISTDTPEEINNDNSAIIITTVTEGLPEGAGIATPNSGGTTPSVYWENPTTFTYTSCGSATGVDIKIHINDGGSDITGQMSKVTDTDWSYTTTFYPRHGAATVTYEVIGCSVTNVNFNIYIDPAGYVYDDITGARIPGAVVTLQRLNDESGNWENVPVGENIMQPDTNPLITGLDGQYEWLTLAGTYRVHVEAVGYIPADSRWVTVPPPVTDLHVGLRRITYNFDGFFRPVDNPPMWNSVKAGSGVPVKFSLNGDQGLGVIASGFPKSSSIKCDSNAIVEVDETVTAGSSSLSYDETADQYIYVWKTDKTWSNTCRQLNVKLVDGTTHVANFKFT